MISTSLERQESTPSMLEYDVEATASRTPPPLAARTGLPAALDSGETVGSS